MPLDQGPLKDALQASLTSYPTTAVLAGSAWADAVADHVAAGHSPQGVPPTSASIAAGKAGMAASIAAAVQVGTAAGAGAGVGAAVVLFYQGLLFVGITPGTVTAVGGAAALSAAMSAAFSANTVSSATMAQAAEVFAGAIHACAQTVIVTHVAPAAIAGPLT